MYRYYTAIQSVVPRLSLLYSFTFNRLWAISVSNSDDIEENYTTSTLYCKPSYQYVFFPSCLHRYPKIPLHLLSPCSITVLSTLDQNSTNLRPITKPGYRVLTFFSPSQDSSATPQGLCPSPVPLSHVLCPIGSPTTHWQLPLYPPQLRSLNGSILIGAKEPRIAGILYKHVTTVRDQSAKYSCCRRPSASSAQGPLHYLSLPKRFVPQLIALTSMDADLNTYPILIPPASNTFHFCHHPQPHHSQHYHAQSIIYHPSFIINGNSQYRAYSITISIFPIFSRLPSPLRPPLNSVK